MTAILQTVHESGHHHFDMQFDYEIPSDEHDAAQVLYYKAHRESHSVSVTPPRYLAYDSSAMADQDYEQERKRLERVYSAMTEGELRGLAVDAVSLTSEAAQALKAEIARRKLDMALSGSGAEPDVRSEESEELVTVRIFGSLPEAMLAKGMLDSAGVQSAVADDNTGRMLGWGAVGGIRLQVSKDDVNTALDLLTHSSSESCP